LGILDFKKQNEALLIKHLHKFYNKQELPWVKLVWNYYPNGVPQATNLCGSFWWRDIMKLVDKYRLICTTTSGFGDTILFWNDKEWNFAIQTVPNAALFCSGHIALSEGGNSMC
jgi:hypothetical protein